MRHRDVYPEHGCCGVTNGVLRGALAFMLTVGLLNCGSKKLTTSATAQPPLSADLKFDPTPVHVGDERLTVTVKDRTGAPVIGAKVTVFASFATVPGGHAMPMPGMGRAGKVLPAIDDGDGTYQVDTRVTRATHLDYWCRRCHRARTGNDPARSRG